MSSQALPPNHTATPIYTQAPPGRCEDRLAGMAGMRPLPPETRSSGRDVLVHRG